MKRITAILSAALVFASALSAFGAGYSEISGDWYLNLMRSEAGEIDPAMMGMDVTLHIGDDGTAVLSSATEGEEDMTGSLTQTGESWTLGWADEEQMNTVTLEDGNLLLSYPEQGMALVFGREKTESETYDPGAVVETAALQDFDGIWEGTSVILMGIAIPMETSGGSVTITVEQGNIHYSADPGDGEMVEMDLQGQVENGVLKAASGEFALNLRLHNSPEGLVMTDGYAEESDDEESIPLYTVYTMAGEEEPAGPAE